LPTSLLFQGSLLADADAPRGWGVGRGVCDVLSLFCCSVLQIYIQAVLKVITFRAARVALFSPMSVCVSVRIFLSVCQHGSVTTESRDFQGLILWAKGRPCSKMAIVLHMGAWLVV